MEKQSETETKNTVESASAADGALSENELDQVSAGDEAPKETVTFPYGGLIVQYHR
jgi:hypothetical protein